MSLSPSVVMCCCKRAWLCVAYHSVAMKRNPATGKLEEFHSAALQDDLPDEEEETAQIEVPVGDDY